MRRQKCVLPNIYDLHSTCPNELRAVQTEAQSCSLQLLCLVRVSDFTPHWVLLGRAGVHSTLHNMSYTLARHKIFCSKNYYWLHENKATLQKTGVRTLQLFSFHMRRSQLLVLPPVHCRMHYTWPIWHYIPWYSSHRLGASPSFLREPFYLINVRTFLLFPRFNLIFFRSLSAKNSRSTTPPCNFTVCSPLRIISA